MNRDTKSEKILARYAAGERVFRDLDRDDGIYDFSRCDLRGAVFAGNYIFASFTEANLEGADFSDCNVKTSDFSRAKLAAATFSGSAIDAAVFDGADLTSTNFEKASAYGYVFGKGELPRH
ncbi:pentapeptide repeat-containing protein [Rhizobium lusitanum]|uniref:pentapeptide repeat-containing protein n=1 Tax=Rhizobium lusitanum TaxID=293958 RepID=UPI0016115A70|nr:pentapeptide repeat-containing protein [Rhizobium lusitanum]QND47856.1 pentapeptide repeat-containing protein [Rhizobium lusitanum]